MQKMPLSQQPSAWNRHQYWMVPVILAPPVVGIEPLVLGLGPGERDLEGGRVL